MFGLMISSSILVIVICVIRCLFRGRVDNRMIYALWILLIIKLVLPFPVYLSERLYGSTASLNTTLRILYTVNDWKSPIYSIVGKEQMDSWEKGIITSEDDLAKVHEVIRLYYFVCTVWGVGSLFVFASQIINERRLRRILVLNREEVEYSAAELRGIRPSRARSDGASKLAHPHFAFAGINLSGQKVYLVKKLATPMLVRGKWFKTDLYLPDHITDDRELVSHAILHENTHRKHGDIWWGYVRNILVAVYWFHPLVWFAAYLSKRDAEYACDSGVLEKMNREERVAYGGSLLKLVERNKNRLTFCSPVAMGASHSEMKRRIKMIKMGTKKSVSFTTIAKIVLLTGIMSLFLAACTPIGSDSVVEIENKEEQYAKMEQELKDLKMIKVKKIEPERYEEMKEKIYENYFQNKEDTEHRQENLLYDGDMHQIVYDNGDTYQLMEWSNNYIYWYLDEKDDIYEKTDEQVIRDETEKLFRLLGLEYNNGENGYAIGRLVTQGDNSTEVHIKRYIDGKETSLAGNMRSDIEDMDDMELLFGNNKIISIYFHCLSDVVGIEDYEEEVSLNSPEKVYKILDDYTRSWGRQIVVDTVQISYVPDQEKDGVHTLRPQAEYYSKNQWGKVYQVDLTTKEVEDAGYSSEVLIEE